MPDSYFFTCRTCAAWPSGSKLRWITPTPPACAMAIAMRASVTVSIAEAMIGILSGMARVDAGADVDFGGKHIRKAGFQKHVVEREGFANPLKRLHHCQLLICGLLPQQSWG